MENEDMLRLEYFGPDDEICLSYYHPKNVHVAFSGGQYFIAISKDTAKSLAMAVLFPMANFDKYAEESDSSEIRPGLRYFKRMEENIYKTTIDGRMYYCRMFSLLREIAKSVIKRSEE